VKQTYQGSCHCGAVRFEVDADIDHVRVCNCSICYHRGALNFRVPDEALRLHTSWDDLTLYQWGSFTAEDYFCPKCRILPFRRPSFPTEQELADRGGIPFTGWAINTRCLHDLDTTKLEVEYADRRDTPVEEVTGKHDRPLARDRG
jgi:hypothetical protein